MATICIDSGHGGEDPGAVGDNGVREADVVLGVAVILRELLVRSCDTTGAGHSVVMTRKDDVYVSLSKRCQISNNADADLFLSIHLNSVLDDDDERDPEGIETLCATPSKAGLRLASNVQQSVCKAFLDHKNRGVKGSPSASYPRRLYVLWGTAAPAALCELEFVSSVKWQDWIARPDTMAKYAAALCEGVENYLA